MDTGNNHRIEELKKILPEVFSEDTIDLKKLKKVIIDSNYEIKEDFEFNWNGKTRAKRVAYTTTNKKLILDEKESVNSSSTKNIYIEGDNLDGLKLLVKDFKDKIKMIYIDPPYNTGNHFVYKDEFEPKSHSGRKRKDEIIPEKSNLHHTNWLNMMYPRLLLSHSLLKENGYLFISIGDNELFNLKKICDEIYGEENFIDCCPRVAKRTSNKGTFFKTTKDYILVYSKDITKLTEKFEVKHQINLDEFKYSDEHGIYKKSGASLYQPSLDSRTNQRYYIECPDGSFVIPPGNVFPEEVKDGAKVIPESNQDKCWRWSHDTYLKKKDMLLFTHARKNCPLVDENGNPSKWNVYDKVYFEAEEHKSFLPEDIIYDYPNSQGTKELLDLGINFSFAKPTGLVKYLMEIVHFNSDDIILDFFSGSGTTGDACMRLNQEDNGTRRFILVQTPEVIEEKTEEFKEGFKTISEIGKERLRRIGEKLVLENPDNNTDFGFRVYKIRED